MNMRAVDKCNNNEPEQVVSEQVESEQTVETSSASEPVLAPVKDASVKAISDEKSEHKPDESMVSGALASASGSNKQMSVDNDMSQTQNTVIEVGKPDFVQTLLEVYEKTNTIMIGLLSVITGLVLWHLATEHNLNYFINFESIPGPVSVGQAFFAQLTDSEFYIHILVSMKRILIAYSFAVILGIGIGLVIGRSRNMRAAVSPYIEIIRPIPAVAWIPLAILMWPTEESSIIYITFLGALFPIILNTVHGVEQTPEVLIRAALSLGAKRSQVFRHVVFPAALPSISAGLAIGMGVSWFSLLAGEIISGQYGIGYFTWNAYSLINYPDIVVGMLVIGGLGSLSTFLVRLAMKPSLRWKAAQR